MKGKRVFTITCLLVLLAGLGVGLATAQGVVRQPQETEPAAAHKPAKSSPAGGGSINGNPLGANFFIRDDQPEELGPTIAYNSQSREYLAVFWNDRPANDDIRAERVRWDGKLLGGNWVAAGVGADRQYPDVAYNSQRNEYLVVWQETDTAGSSYIRAQRLSADAQLQGGVITIAYGAVGVMENYYPVVGYASTADKYLVVWEYAEIAPSYSHILGQVLSSEGQLLGSNYLVSEDPGTKPRHNPDLAYNRHGNGYLVVWDQYDAGTSLYSIHGQLVHGDGGLTGGPIQIASHPVWSMSPAVAAIPTGPSTYKYLVVYEYAYAVGDCDIYGRLVEEDGTVASGDLGFAGSARNEIQPAVAGSEMNYQYLVAWAEQISPGQPFGQPIIVRTASSAGVVSGERAMLEGDAAYWPAVSAGPSGDFLVAWADKRIHPDYDIYGRLWGNRAYLPLAVRNFP